MLPRLATEGEGAAAKTAAVAAVRPIDSSEYTAAPGRVALPTIVPAKNDGSLSLVRTLFLLFPRVKSGARETL
jgi:hypothetical protein